MKKTLSSFIFVAALLPVVIFGAVMKEKLFLSASADSNPILRVWFEPSEVVLSPGQNIIVKVMVESEAVKKLVGTVNLPLIVSGEIQTDTGVVIFPKPFLGKTEVGKIKVTNLGGTGQIKIDEESSLVSPSEFILQTAGLNVILR